jgi:hypothetical protein
MVANREGAIQQITLRELRVVKIRDLENVGGDITIGSNLTFNDGKNIITGTSTGSKICTSASQKLGFYGTTPLAQQTGVSVSSAAIHAALVSLGLITA